MQDGVKGPQWHGAWTRSHDWGRCGYESWGRARGGDSRRHAGSYHELIDGWRAHVQQHPHPRQSNGARGRLASDSTARSMVTLPNGSALVRTALGKGERVDGGKGCCGARSKQGRSMCGVSVEVAVCGWEVHACELGTADTVCGRNVCPDRCGACFDAACPHATSTKLGGADGWRTRETDRWMQSIASCREQQWKTARSVWAVWVLRGLIAVFTEHRQTESARVLTKKLRQPPPASSHPKPYPHRITQQCSP
ncbi:hypothetical protein BDW22DRAFT_976198 [Trametopsis cervina]|nr:hypothetical protein BDW22DRAFT_976198 [Trametopsis cervina]